MTEIRRHRIVHKTSIGYDRRATASYNEAADDPAPPSPARPRWRAGSGRGR